MTTQPTLDPRDARPLTSREISKVLCGIIGGVAVFNPDTRDEMPLVLEVLRRGGTLEQAEATSSKLLAPGKRRPTTTWAAALGATVWSLRGWCNPRDVDTAIAWVAENLSMVIPAQMQYSA